jgi:hypothetical protein
MFFDNWVSVFSPNFCLFLKVSQCEIFVCSDFHDFFTIKFLWVGDFRVKKIEQIFRGSFRASKFVTVGTCMLSLI